MIEVTDPENVYEKLRREDEARAKELWTRRGSCSCGDPDCDFCGLPIPSRANGGHKTHYVRGRRSLCGHEPLNSEGVTFYRARWLRGELGGSTCCRCLIKAEREGIILT